MCGIIGGFGKRQKAKMNGWVIDQYEDQHSRGTSGFGLIGWNQGGAARVERACTPAKFMFDIHAKGYQMLIAHHRQPTSSDNTLDQTHPIYVTHDSLKHDYLVVHNGIIRNCKELFKLHTELGFEYTTLHTLVDWKGKEEDKFNDSESLAIEVARYAEGHTTEIATDGNATFLAVQLDKVTKKPLRILFGKNGNPLHMDQDEDGLYLSSEGRGEDIKENVLYSFDPKDPGKVEEQPLAWRKEAPKEAKQSTIGYKTNTDEKPTYGPYGGYDDGYGTTYGHTDDERWFKKDEGDGVMYSHKELDDVAESINTDVETYLDMLDDPEQINFVDPKVVADLIYDTVMTAKQELLDKYANAIPDAPGDTLLEAAKD